MNKTSTSEINELLLQIATHQRLNFYKLWNQLLRSEDWAQQKLSAKIAFIVANLESPKAVQLPSDIRFISMVDSEYPQNLFNLTQPPLGLFVMGKFRSEDPMAAVIGSRRPTPYSLRMAYRASLVWAKNGWTIVSGGALGVDIEAHRAALDAGKSTIVVNGGGLKRLYPKSHEKIFEKILIQGGALISEYPPYFEPKPYTFPERNRIIAAISDVLFLAQAHEKSGSLGTAKTALDLGKEIYVLRPPPADAGFSGSSLLISSGARCLSEPQELELCLPKT